MSPKTVPQLFDLDGRVAIVTGGNGGIGFGMAAALASAGARVVVAGRSATKNRDAAEQLANEALAVTVDVANIESCGALAREVVEQCGKIDILVNCAGINIRKQPHEFELDEWNAVLATNLTGTFCCAKAVYPAMKSGGGGKIINISSVAAIFGAPFVAPYGASKAAVAQLTRTLAVAWAKDNIQVNAVLPGWVDTELTREARRVVEGISDRAIGRTPARRWGLPSDFAGVAIFLSSRASDFVTGASIVVDGGYSVEG